MDDNARPHRTLAVEEQLEREDITRMDWPAYSPDLNPIEHVWDVLGRRIAARLHPPENTQQLKQRLIEEWVTPTARNVALAGSEYAETVRSNHCKRISKKFRNSCLLDEDNLIELMTVYNNQEVDNDEVESVIQLLTADLIREGLKFAANMVTLLTSCTFNLTQNNWYNLPGRPREPMEPGIMTNGGNFPV
ncbi:transposable element Tcb2 transposase [Trichonephila clavipes]|nr:transposable element Tcb2 transposase [Trichonephila clavipes]